MADNCHRLHIYDDVEDGAFLIEAVIAAVFINLACLEIKRTVLGGLFMKPEMCTLELITKSHNINFQAHFHFPIGEDTHPKESELSHKLKSNYHRIPKWELRK